jgi:disulfide bond formation protein DsbB
MTDTMVMERSRAAAGGPVRDIAASSAFRAARLLALLIPTALLAGAWTSQLWGGLTPCEMCHWQRWPHYAAVPLAALAFVAPGKRAWVALAAVAIATSGAIGVYHAGVEWKLWAGHTACTAGFAGGLSTGQLLQQIMAAPIQRCDEAQWRLLGVSLAGWNALFSLGGAALIGVLLGRSRRA